MKYEQPKIELLTEGDLRSLIADAGQWRAVLAGLAERGFDQIGVAEILKIFPNFRAMAGLSATDPVVGAEKGAEVPQGVPGVALDAFLTGDFGASLLSQRAAIRSVPGVNVREFAEAETVFGPVQIGYTEDGDLAFTFALLGGDTYLVRVAEVLSRVIAALRSRGRLVPGGLVGKRWVM